LTLYFDLDFFLKYPYIYIANQVFANIKWDTYCSKPLFLYILMVVLLLLFFTINLSIHSTGF